jgi:hypothetical protein
VELESIYFHINCDDSPKKHWSTRNILYFSVSHNWTRHENKRLIFFWIYREIGLGHNEQAITYFQRQELQQRFRRSKGHNKLTLGSIHTFGKAIYKKLPFSKKSPWPMDQQVRVELKVEKFNMAYFWKLKNLMSVYLN